MMNRNLLFSAVLCAVLVPGATVFAQGPGPAHNISPQRHPNLAAAQTSIDHAYRRIETAQGANRDRLGGHAEKAKELLAQAANELKMAAEYANHRHR